MTLFNKLHKTCYSLFTETNNYLVLFKFVPGRDTKHCNEDLCLSVCLSVCLSTRLHISKITRNFTKFSAHVIRDCNSVLLWQQWNMSVYFWFCGWYRFSHNGPYGAWHWQQWCQRCAKASSQNFQCICQRAPCCWTMSSYTTAANCEPGVKLMSTIAL